MLAPLCAALLQELGCNWGTIEKSPSGIVAVALCAVRLQYGNLDGKGPGPAIGASMRRHCVLRAVHFFPTLGRLGRYEACCTCSLAV